MCRITVLFAIIFMGTFHEPGAQVYQQLSQNQDVTVMVSPGALELPVGASEAVLDDVTVSTALEGILFSYSAEKVLKVLVYSEPVGGTITGPDGRPVRSLDFSRMYVIRFPAGTVIDDVVVALSQCEDIVFAEKVPHIQP